MSGDVTGNVLSSSDVFLLGDCVIKEEVVETSEIDEKVFLGDFVIKEEIVETSEIDEYALDGEEYEPKPIKIEPPETTSGPCEDIKPFVPHVLGGEGSLIETYIQRDGTLAFTGVSAKKLAPNRKAGAVRKKKGARRKSRAKNKKTQNVCKLIKNATSLNGKLSDAEALFCSECNEEFQIRDDFDSHLSQHYTLSDGLFICSCCYYTTDKRFRINFHIRRCHCRGRFAEKSYACAMCDWSFFEKKDLERHVKIHLGVKHFKCDCCRMSFYVEEDLKKHQKVHTKINKKSKSISKLQKYKCEHCGYEAGSQGYLDRHIKGHLKMYDYECDRCEYKSMFIGDLKKHYTVHFSERPFVCDRCSKTFKRRAHLISHTRSKYPCYMRANDHS